MIPDRLKKLLTGYVDGELSARQRRAVQKLLHRSPEARRLLSQLQDDSRELRSVPRLRLDRDLTRPVLQTIALEGIHPSRKRAAAQPAFPAWAGLAAAASVLLVIGFASYAYFTIAKAHLDQPMVLQQNREPQPADPSPVPEHGLAKGGGVDGNPQGIGELKPSADPNDAIVQVGKNETKPLDKVENPGNGANQNGNIFGAGNTNEPKFDLNIPGLRLSYHVVRDLDLDDPRQRLLVELQKDPAYRLELFCLDTNKAFERLQTALKSNNIKLQIDAEAQLRLKHKVAASYAFLLDDVTPDELAKVLQYLGSEDKKAAAKKPSDGQFGKLLLNPMAPSDLEELAKMLGVEPGQVPPRKKSTGGVDIRRPLSETTAIEVTQALGQGSVRPGDPSKVSAKTPERAALALAHKVTASKEARLFLDSRKEPRPGTVQVLLVLQVPRG